MPQLRCDVAVVDYSEINVDDLTFLVPYERPDGEWREVKLGNHRKGLTQEERGCMSKGC